MVFLLAILSLVQINRYNPVECYDDTFCIETEETATEVNVYVRSLVKWDVTMVLDMELQNMRPDVDLPFTDSYSGESRTKVLTLRVQEPGTRWAFEFSLRWILGNFKARHQQGHIYELPYSEGREFLVGQGFQGEATHQGKYAIDWDMPVGTLVRAARGGIVMELAENFTEGRPDVALQARANYVKIKHEDGTIGNYVHLDHDGVRVRLGDAVKAGDVIARSGNTGFSTGPHLHFEVYSATRELSRRTIPIEFKTRSRGVISLEEGFYYRR